MTKNGYTGICGVEDFTLMQCLKMCKGLRRNLRIVITESNVVITDVLVKRDKFNPSELAPKRLHDQHLSRITIDDTKRRKSPMIIQFNL